MKVDTWKTKDIWFKASERKSATKLVNKLLKNGWVFQSGYLDKNLQVVGDRSLPTQCLDGEETEEIQLYLI